MYLKLNRPKPEVFLSHAFGLGRVPVEKVDPSCFKLFFIDFFFQKITFWKVKTFF